MGRKEPWKSWLEKALPTKLSTNDRRAQKLARDHRYNTAIQGTFGRLSRNWIDHYNAACVYAINVDRYEEHQLSNGDNPWVDRARKCLEDALLIPDSGLPNEDREWVLVNDPDLEALRTYPQFRRLEARHFLSQFPIEKRRESVFELMMSRYYSELVASSGKVMESRWHQRTESLTKPINVHEQR